MKMSNIKERLVKRLPSIITTKNGLLKLNQEQKEALAERIEVFLKLESGAMIEAHGKHVGLREIPSISMN